MLEDLDPVFNVVAVPASASSATGALNSTTNDLEQESLHSRTMGRLRHLDILEEVGLFAQDLFRVNKKLNSNLSEF